MSTDNNVQAAIIDDAIENVENSHDSLNNIEISEQFISAENAVTTSSPRSPSSPIPIDNQQQKETPPSTPPLPPAHLSQNEMPPPPPPPASIIGQPVKPKPQLKRSFSAKPLTTTSRPFRPFSSRLENSNSNNINNNYFMNQDSLSHAESHNTPLFITHVTLNLDVPGNGLNKPSIPSWKYNNVRKNCANFSYTALVNKK
jgi:hypothetical protein